jgi:hypothetical protein
LNKPTEKFFSIDISNLEFKEFIDEETALMIVKVCSSGDNAHGFPFTKETMKEAAERSLRGKPIVAKYSSWQGDFEGHHELEVPIGYFIEHQQMQYLDNPDGTCSLFAYAVLWKTYASKEHEIFVQKKESGKAPTKGVSMEIKVNTWGGEWNGDKSKTEIKKFSFMGVTILGDRYSPASPGAQVEMISFSKIKKKEVEKYFTENSDKIKNDKDSRSLLKKCYNELSLSTKNFVEKEGEVMPMPEETKVESTENFDVDLKVSDPALEDEVKLSAEGEEEVKAAVDPESEEKEEEETKEAEPESETEEPETEDFKAKYEEMVAKVEELQSCVDVYMSELETLRTYKAEKEESEKIFTIEETISKFSDILPADVIEEYRGRIKDIKYSEVTAFCNEIKARIVDFVDLKSDKNPNRMSVQIPPKPKKEKSEFLY